MSEEGTYRRVDPPSELTLLLTRANEELKTVRSHNERRIDPYLRELTREIIIPIVSLGEALAVLAQRVILLEHAFKALGREIATCEKCGKAREDETRVETIEGKGCGWKCKDCGWWTWIVRLPDDTTEGGSDG